MAGQQQNLDWVDNKKSLENFVNWLASLFLCFLLIFLSACADNRRKTRKLFKLTDSLPLPCFCLWSSLFLKIHFAIVLSLGSIKHCQHLYVNSPCFIFSSLFTFPCEWMLTALRTSLAMLVFQKYKYKHKYRSKYTNKYKYKNSHQRKTL